MAAPSEHRPHPRQNPAPGPGAGQSGTTVRALRRPARRSRRGGSRSVRRRESEAASALEMLASAFGLLTTGPRPLSVDGRVVGHGLPHRSIPLPELRAILLHPSTGRGARDAAWRYIIAHARGGSGSAAGSSNGPGGVSGAAWVVGAAGVALPMLRRMSADLVEGPRGEVGEVQAAVLAGFVEAVYRLDVERPGVITRLRWAAYRAGVVARYARDGVVSVVVPPPESAPPPRPWGHPDLVLADAVAKGVLSPVQAELIGRSRLEDLTLKEAAAELGVGYEAARKARRRGEARLVAAIAAGDVEEQLSPPAPNFGLNPVGASAVERAGVRGGSTESGGTPDSHRPLLEGGAFRSPAHPPQSHRQGARTSARHQAGGCRTSGACAGQGSPEGSGEDTS